MIEPAAFWSLSCPRHDNDKGGESVIREAVQFMNQCQDGHSDHSMCPPRNMAPLPARVIDIGDPSQGTAPKLHIASNEQKGHYAALSTSISEYSKDFIRFQFPSIF